MRQRSSQPQPSHESSTERSLLGGALSVEFSDCSIAAADLSKQADELMQSKLARGTYLTAEKYIVGDLEEPQRLLIAPLNEGTFNLHGRQTCLVIAQPIEIVEDPEIIKTRRFLIPRKTVFNRQVNMLRDDPMLAVRVGDDTLLPIASFARRKNGQCSYVQLGREMYDDNFYVTAADDESTRHGLIEAMRCAVKGFPWTADKEKSETYRDIQKFVDQQAVLVHEALTEAYEQQLVRNLFGKMKTDELKQMSLTVIGEDEANAPQMYDTTTLIPRTIMADNRQVSLIAARPSHARDEWGKDRVELLAVTRSGVAMQIASISRQFMQLEYKDDIQLPPAHHDQVVRDLLFAVIARPTVSSMPSPEKEGYNNKNLTDVEGQIAKYCFKIGALDKYEQCDEYDNYGRRTEVKLSGSVVRRLNDFYMYPDREYSPYPDSAPLSLALSRREALQHHNRRIFTVLKVGERFRQLLGEARKCDEVLMSYAAKLALQEEGLRAEFNDVQIGKTKAAAVIAAKVDMHDSVQQLGISGRPASMPDEDLKPLISVTLDPTKPYLGQEKAIRNGFSKPNVDEIISILSRISVAQSYKTQADT